MCEDEEHLVYVRSPQDLYDLKGFVQQAEPVVSMWTPDSCLQTELRHDVIL